KTPQRITALLYFLDGALIAVATVLAYVARFEGRITATYMETLPWVIIFTTIVYLAAFTLAGAYRVVLRYVGVETALRLGVGTLGAFAVLLMADLLIPFQDNLNWIPLGVLFFQAVLVLMFVAALRISSRARAYLVGSRAIAGGRRVLIVGAG